MTIQKNDNERRRARRFPSAELKTKLKVKKGLFSDWIDVNTRDYSKLGIAIETDRQLEIDQSATLAISLVVDMGEIILDKIEGKVRNKAKEGFNHRYGIEFDLESKKSAQIQEQLLRIESMLEKSTRLQERLSSQQAAAR